jgi:hypothetical protein
MQKGQLLLGMLQSGAAVGEPGCFRSQAIASAVPSGRSSWSAAGCVRIPVRSRLPVPPFDPPAVTDGASKAVHVNDRFRLRQGLLRRVQEIATTHRRCLSAALLPVEARNPPSAMEEPPSEAVPFVLRGVSGGPGWLEVRTAERYMAGGASVMPRVSTNCLRRLRAGPRRDRAHGRSGTSHFPDTIGARPGDRRRRDTDAESSGRAFRQSRGAGMPGARRSPRSELDTLADHDILFTPRHSPTSAAAPVLLAAPDDMPTVYVRVYCT